MDIVLRESERLNTTIRSFLAYARPRRFQIARFDVRRALNDTALLLRNSAEVREGHLIDVDIPIAIKEGGFAEGQRVVASFILTTVTDASIVGPDQSVPIYLILFTDSRDGLPYDYNQIRVFVWDSHRAEHGYEMAYHERGLFGLLPVIVGKEYFGEEGVLPTFRLHVKDQNGGEEDLKYKLIGGMVKRVTTNGEVPPAHLPVATKSAVKKQKR